MKLVKEFVPCADEVWRLHNLDEPDCLHFRKFCDEGGTLNGEGDRTTRQGTYCCTPSGKFLGSVNSRDPKRMAEMLRGALAKWKEIPKKERLLDSDPKETLKQINRAETKYPEDGLVLKVNSRDMPRKGLDENDWRTNAWNFDFAWFNEDEVKTLLPKKFEKKHSWELPSNLVKRLARLHFVDNVRGQTPVYPADSVETAEITAVITKLRKGVVTFELTGNVKMAHDGRAMELKLLGECEWNTKKDKFDKFEIVAVGERTGRSQYNARQDDTGTAPIGFCLQIAGDKATDKVAPASFGEYGW